MYFKGKVRKKMNFLGRANFLFFFIFKLFFGIFQRLLNSFDKKNYITKLRKK